MRPASPWYGAVPQFPYGLALHVCENTAETQEDVDTCDDPHGSNGSISMTATLITI
jgi:hypothetical protein